MKHLFRGSFPREMSCTVLVIITEQTDIIVYIIISHPREIRALIRPPCVNEWRIYLSTYLPIYWAKMISFYFYIAVFKTVLRVKCSLFSGSFLSFNIKQTLKKEHLEEEFSSRNVIFFEHTYVSSNINVIYYNISRFPQRFTVIIFYIIFKPNFFMVLIFFLLFSCAFFYTLYLQASSLMTMANSSKL